MCRAHRGDPRTWRPNANATALPAVSAFARRLPCFAGRVGKIAVILNGRNDAGVEHARVAAAKVDVEALAKKNSEVLPDANWVENLDPNSGMHYYWHKVTNETVWEKPASFIEGTTA